MTLVTRTCAALIGLAATVSLAGCAGVAVAGPSLDDQAFLRNLEGHVAITSPDAAISNAHQVCTQMEGGTTLIAAGFNQLALNPQWDEYTAGWFVGSAIAIYCPEFTPQAS